MTTNGVNNAEEADMMECDGEKVVTMMDVLQEQQEFEEDANAVLGASDDKECTYSKGYIKRQAIYVCLTCCSEAKDDPSQRAGVCLACSLNCHENHELIELYTKRNFKCDCGNPKFKSHPCQFTPHKSDLNEENNYNQNFSGLYCICHRPYPDPEAAVEDEMIQCIICEDWLHSTHLEAVLPTNDLYAEMICKACMEKNEFLHDYSKFAVNYEVNVDVTSTNETDSPKTVENGQLANGIMKSPPPDVMTNEEVIKDQKDINCSHNESEAIFHQDTVKDNEIKSIEDSTNMDCTTETSEKPQPEGTNSSALMNNEVPNMESHSPIQLDQNTELENSNPKGSKEMDLGSNNSNFIEPTINSQDEADNNSDHKELIKTVSEQNTECIKELTEHESSPTEMTLEKDNIIAMQVNSTNELSEINHTPETISKDGDVTDPSTISTAENGEKDQPSEENDLFERTEKKSEDTPENSATEDCQKQSKVCEVDSLEAATNELSELMSEGDNNLSSIDTEKDKQNHNEPQAKENDLKSEELNNETKVSDDCEVPENEEKDIKRKLIDTTEEVLIKKQKLDSTEDCLRPKGIKRTLNGASFWPSNFRQKLCTCSICLSMYKDLNVLFLTDIEDTVTAYETLGKEINDGGPATQYEKGLQALSSLDRVQQINALTEYNKMRDKLLDFLKSFKDRKEIVKEEDIKAFFAGMKPRREPDGVYFCR